VEAGEVTLPEAADDVRLRVAAAHYLGIAAHLAGEYRVRDLSQGLGWEDGPHLGKPPAKLTNLPVEVRSLWDPLVPRALACDSGKAA
jgi:hypothetical protein